MARFPCFSIHCTVYILHKDCHPEGRTRGVSCLVPCLSGSSSLKVVEYTNNRTFIPETPAPTTPMCLPVPISPSVKKEDVVVPSKNVTPISTPIRLPVSISSSVTRETTVVSSKNLTPTTIPKLRNHTRGVSSKTLHSIIAEMKRMQKSSVRCPSVLSYPSYSIPASCLSSPL